MAWRVAKSLEVLLAQINDVAPWRSKASDGALGDPSHSSRTSDHNPDPFGVVRARDFTHDPDKGADMEKFAEALRAGKDPRIKYVIWNRRIFSSLIDPWEWRPYSGVNAHNKHMHVSVVADSRADTTLKWSIEGKDEIDMATLDELRKIFREELNKAVKTLAVGKKQPDYNPDNVNLKAVLEKKG